MAAVVRQGAEKESARPALPLVLLGMVTNSPHSTRSMPWLVEEGEGGGAGAPVRRAKTLRRQLQRAAYSEADLVELADGLDAASGLPPASPCALLPTHRTPLYVRWLGQSRARPLTHGRDSLGNLDVNVMIAALQAHDLHCLWYGGPSGTRAGAQTPPLGRTAWNDTPTEGGGRTEALERVDLGLVVGVLVNRAGMLPCSKHWFALRRVGSCYYNLDSRAAAPTAFTSDSAVRPRRARCSPVSLPPLYGDTGPCAGAGVFGRAGGRRAAAHARAAIHCTAHVP
jgi:hypothetical protein